MSVDGDRTHRRRSRGKALPALVVAQVVIAGVALGVMVFVAAKIGPLLKEKARLEAEITDYKKEVASLQADLQRTREELEHTRQQLSETVDMARFMHPIDMTDPKGILTHYPKAGTVFSLILQLKDRGVGWHLGGNTPDVGFDSPSFARYVLGRAGVPSHWQMLPPTRHPNVGDLVFYPAGYVLFYFEGGSRGPFVIGMTPFGIVALAPDFAQPVGYAHTGLGP